MRLCFFGSYACVPGGTFNRMGVWEMGHLEKSRSLEWLHVYECSKRILPISVPHRMFNLFPSVDFQNTFRCIPDSSPSLTPVCHTVFECKSWVLSLVSEGLINNAILKPSQWNNFKHRLRKVLLIWSLRITCQDQKAAWAYPVMANLVISTCILMIVWKWNVFGSASTR